MEKREAEAAASQGVSILLAFVFDKINVLV